MKRLLSIILFCLVCWPPVLSPTLAQSVALEAKELLAIEYNRSEAIAKHDTKVLNDLYADDFRGVTAIGLEVDKARLMDVFTLDNPNVKFALDELKARILGETAIVTGRLTGKTVTGEVVHDSKYIHVYAKRSGRWQLIAGQGTMIQPPSAAR